MHGTKPPSSTTLPLETGIYVEEVKKELPSQDFLSEIFKYNSSETFSKDVS